MERSECLNSLLSMNSILAIPVWKWTKNNLYIHLTYCQINIWKTNLQEEKKILYAFNQNLPYLLLLVNLPKKIYFFQYQGKAENFMGMCQPCAIFKSLGVTPVKSFLELQVWWVCSCGSLSTLGVPLLARKKAYTYRCGTCRLSNFFNANNFYHIWST